MRNLKSLALAVALVAALATPAFAAPRDPGQLPGNHNGGNFISRLVTRIVHLFDVYPIEPHP